MAKLQKTSDGWYMFHCQGCEETHAIPLNGERGWTWNNSLDAPTIKPSILVNVGGANPTVPICHSFVTDGNIQYLPDCTHPLAGKTVPLPDWGNA